MQKQYKAISKYSNYRLFLFSLNQNLKSAAIIIEKKSMLNFKASARRLLSDIRQEQGRAIAQAVSHWLTTAAGRIQTRV
jgi:hypothetical protein